MTRARSVLVLGGARSGKSAFAQKLAEATAPQRLYLATGAALDEEMAARIARHRAQRGAGWTTREEPLALAGALTEEARAGRVVLVDCLTLWLSNALLAGRDLGGDLSVLCAALRAARGPVILVSNEVGSGVVPESSLGRAFRDWQGRLNQQAGEACDAAVLVVAGLPLALKPTPPVRLALE